MKITLNIGMGGGTGVNKLTRDQRVTRTLAWIARNFVRVDHIRLVHGEVEETMVVSGSFYRTDITPIVMNLACFLEQDCIAVSVEPEFSADSTELLQYLVGPRRERHEPFYHAYFHYD